MITDHFLWSLVGLLLYPLNPLPNVEAVADSEHGSTPQTKAVAFPMLPLVWRVESGPPPSKDKEMNKEGHPSSLCLSRWL